MSNTAESENGSEAGYSTKELETAVRQLQGDINAMTCDFADLQTHLTATIWRAASAAAVASVTVLILVIVLI